MPSRFLISAFCAGCVFLAAYSWRAESRMSGAEAPTPAGSIETGVHWANPNDFAQLKRLGHQFAIVSLDRDPQHWREVFDAAEKVGIRLIAGLHPYPYRLEAGAWVIEPAGRAFIEFAGQRRAVTKAIYGFNEPYWLDPATGENNPCGVYSAAELRQLRTEIRQIWPQALVYHDFGRPSLWAPGGSMERDNRCVGLRYRDVSQVADYAGIWFYPFQSAEPYQREELVTSMREELAYVTRFMQAEAIMLGQAFRCARCSSGTRMPTVEEIRDLNCTFRWMGPQAISWYAWRQPFYQESLAGHRELWEALGPRGCPDGRSL